eukprot:403351642
MKKQKTLIKKKTGNNSSLIPRDSLKMITFDNLRDFEFYKVEQIMKLNLQETVDSKLWRETTDSRFVPFLKFDLNIKEIEGGEALSNIDFRKEGGIVSINKESTKTGHERKIKMLKPLEIAYHSKNGYVRLDRDNSIIVEICDVKIKQKLNTWQCTLIERDDENNPYFKDNLSIDPRELKFFISIELLITIEAKLSQSKHRVDISDPINGLIRLIETLHQKNFLILQNGRQLDITKTFYQNNIHDKEKLFAIELNNVVQQKRNSRDIKFFKRFQHAENDCGWSSVDGEYDAIILKPLIDVIICGVGIYEEYPNGGELILKYKYKITDENDDIVISETSQKSELVPFQPDQVDEHIIKHEFVNYPEGIIVKAGQHFNFMQQISCSESYYSHQGDDYQTIPNTDMGIFTFQDSQDSSNSTTVESGIIPGFLYITI